MDQLNPFGLFIVALFLFLLLYAVWFYLLGGLAIIGIYYLLKEFYGRNRK